MTFRIPFNDISASFSNARDQIDAVISKVIDHGHFIQGEAVQRVEHELAQYMGVPAVISCGNGTDALQIALMALNLDIGDEVIIPAFGYFAIAEVVLLLGLQPVMVDIDLATFCIDVDQIESAITDRSKVIVPIHLFGQAADMNGILNIARRHNLIVIEDNAQAFGTNYLKGPHALKKLGSFGHISCTSFFPTKILACFGDGGAIFTQDTALADQMRSIARHGQSSKYRHVRLGVNSRLDTLQAAIVSVKLKFLDKYLAQKEAIATRYDEQLSGLSEVIVPFRAGHSDHSFHQYTIRVIPEKRDALKTYLEKEGIQSMIYYPYTFVQQPVCQQLSYADTDHPNALEATQTVLSLPIYAGMSTTDIAYVCGKILSFFQ